MKLVVSVLVFGCLVSAPAWSQTCSGGQTVGPDTAGHCCWPEQGWSSLRQVCVGAPACPAGLQAQGETCVPAQAPVATTPVAPPAAAAAGTVPVRFETSEEEVKYTVTAIENGTERTCAVPCSLQLAPGRVRIEVEGENSFEREVVVPRGPALAQVGYKKRWPLFFAAGGGALLSGVITWVTVMDITRNRVTGLTYATGALAAVIAGLSVTSLIIGIVRKPGILDVKEIRELGAKGTISFEGLSLAPVPGGSFVGAAFTF